MPLATPRPREAMVTIPHREPTASAIHTSELGNTILQDNSLTLGYVEKFG